MKKAAMFSTPSKMRLQCFHSSVKYLSNSALKNEKSVTAAAALPYEAIPSPSTELPFLGSLIDFIKSKEGYHKFYSNLHEKYGDIVKISIMGKHTVCICRPEHVREVIMLNQIKPLREGLISWINYRKKAGISLGPTMSLSQVDHDYSTWRRLRRPVSHLLKPEVAASYIPRVSLIGQDLGETFALTDSKPLTVKDVAKITSMYGFEAISAGLMGKRMGVLGKSDTSIDPKLLEMMDAAATMFTSSAKLLLEDLPFWRIFSTKTLREHDAAWDTLYRIGNEIFENLSVGRDERFANDGIKDYFELMADEELSADERRHLSIDLMIAGIDTTSVAAQWLIWYVAQNPEMQERLALKLQEVMGPWGSNVCITAEHIAESKLNLFVEEILRLHPVIPFHTRFFEEEVVVAGYKIPPRTNIVMNNFYSSTDPRNYKDPKVFDEMRSARKECPFGSKTFGLGARQCPGERFARMELAVLLGALVHRFKIESSDTNETLNANAKLLLTPRDDIKATLKFIPRVN